jgi:hypothetical protein
MQNNGAINEDGIERAKAEYLILAILDENGGEQEYDELQGSLAEVTNELSIDVSDLPLHFSPTSGPLEYQSRSFMRALSRCTNAKSVKKNGGGIELTELGEELLSEPDSLYVPEDFAGTIQKFLSGRRRVQLTE